MLLNPNTIKKQQQTPFWKGVFPKRKEFTPLGNKFFSFKVDPFYRQKQQEISKVAYFAKIYQVYPVPLNDTHYETRLFKYIENFTTKIWKFTDKNSDIFHICAQNIHCGCSLELPHWGISYENPQSMFLSRNKENIK